MVGNEYQIIKKNEHYEVYIDGLFYCSTDTIAEAVAEVEKVGERATKKETM
jgi:hypothetical protein